MRLWSSDNTALILARAILVRHPKISVEIFLGGLCPDGALQVSDLWKKGSEQAQGIAWDQSCDEESAFVMKQKAKISLPYELLAAFANRGLSDTVEFRRLARKYLRPAKNKHCKKVFFLSGVLAEETTQRVLKHILGTQVQPVFVTDFLPEPGLGKKQEISLFTDGDLERVHREAEQFLHAKLKKTVAREAS